MLMLSTQHKFTLCSLLISLCCLVSTTKTQTNAGQTKDKLLAEYNSIKVKARFVFRDAATDQEIWAHTQQGKFLGFITLHGTGKDYSVTEASGDIVDGLIRAINKNR